MKKILSSDLKNNIIKNLSRKYSKILSLNSLKKKLSSCGLDGVFIYDSFFSFSDISDENKTISTIKHCLSDDPTQIIISLLNINFSNENIEYSINGEYYDSYEQSGYCFGTTEINGYSQILRIGEVEYVKSYLNDSNLNDSDLEDIDEDYSNNAKIETKILASSLFDRTITYYCKYCCYNVCVEEIVDNSNHFMNVDVYGIREDETRKALDIDLIESVMNYKSGNIKMAFLNLFTAIDYYIEDLFNILFHQYLDNFHKYSKIEYDTILSKVKDYANSNRRLVAEKLPFTWKELERESELFNEVKNKIKNLENSRNKIAHGEAISIRKEDYVDLLYCFLDLIALYNSYDSFYDFLKKEYKVKKK